ncbi:MAG: hypothetical protein LW832_09435 [Parachlamydia sp.]|nr:hypothetical protein [Parachlamydia sp.]
MNSHKLGYRDNFTEEERELFFENLLKDPSINFQMTSKMWIHQLKTPLELLESWKNYSLRGLADKIACPTLVIDNESETYSKGQAQQLYDHLTCPKTFQILKKIEGADRHCSAGAYSYLNETLFNWLTNVGIRP